MEWDVVGALEKVGSRLEAELARPVLWYELIFGLGYREPEPVPRAESFC